MVNIPEIDSISRILILFVERAVKAVWSIFIVITGRYSLGYYHLGINSSIHFFGSVFIDFLMNRDDCGIRADNNEADGG